ncbi:MAG: hypothetical protein ACXVCP_18740 [Bdellovibrio sp.]
MQNSTLDSSFVNRLKQILADRYGKGLEIRQLMDLTDNYNADTYTRGRDLHIPIKVKGAFLGTAIVPCANDLNEEKRLGVTQLVRMVLEPAMYKWYLERKESNLANLSQGLLDFSNIRLFGEKSFSAEDYEELELIDSPALDNELNTCLIHLEGSNQTINKKVALTIHDLTSRWAFVPFNDIKGQLHSSHDIEKMGTMTIFVENIEALNESEQELLSEYIQESHFDGPLIISSSSKSLSDLSKNIDDGSQNKLNKDLVKEMSANNFEVDRAPLSSEALKEVLELFFIKEPLLDA